MVKLATKRWSPGQCCSVAVGLSNAWLGFDRLELGQPEGRQRKVAVRRPVFRDRTVTACFLRSVFGLVSVVSVDCAAPWRLRVNPALSWFHFVHPLMLLLLYNTVANLWRNQVTPTFVRTIISVVV